MRFFEPIGEHIDAFTDRLRGAISGWRRGQGYFDAVTLQSERQAAWNQTVANGADQNERRRIYLEKECNALREMAKDITRAYLRVTRNVHTNDGSYPDDRLLGMDGYQTTLTLAQAEISMQKRLGQQRKPSWRDRLTTKEPVATEPVEGVRPLS